MSVFRDIACASEHFLSARPGDYISIVAFLEGVASRCDFMTRRKRLICSCRLAGHKFNFVKNHGDNEHSKQGSQHGDLTEKSSYPAYSTEEPTTFID